MLENHWAKEYLTSLYGGDDQDFERLHNIVAASGIENIDDPLLEVNFLRHGASVSRALNLATTMLALCNEDAPIALVAELVEVVEECSSKLADARYDVPSLKVTAQDDPGNGDSLAELGFCLNVLDESEEALSAFTNALEHPDTLCLENHRDCLNNIGWHHYLIGEYEQALGWFDHACNLKESPESNDDEDLEDELALTPPYRLALENVLLTLARMGRLTDATVRLEEYHKWFGRLPRYEASAVEKLGLQLDAIFIRSRISDGLEIETS